MENEYMPDKVEKTIVSDDDMKKPVHILVGEPDDLFEDGWEPEDEIILILTEMGEMSDSEFSEISKLEASNEDFLGNSEAVLSVMEFADEISEEDIADLTDEEIEALKQEAKAEKQAEKQAEDGRPKFTPETQPRDASGKFRQVLARIKTDLGTSGLDRVLDKIEEAENFDNAGNYAGAAKAAADLLEIIDRLDAGALNAEALENVRLSAGELGKVIANLPFAFGEEAQKIRFSDVPPALKDLMEDMITRVEDKIGKEDADIATEGLRRFISGGDYYNQSEISSEMAKLLRLLT